MKRVLSILLVVVLCLSLFTACAAEMAVDEMQGNVSTTDDGTVNGSGYATDGRTEQHRRRASNTAPNNTTGNTTNNTTTTR